MSINQYYCPSDFHEAHLWSQYIIQQSLQQTSSPPPPPPPPASTYSSFISTAKPEEEHEILISMTQVCNYNNNSSYGNEDEIPKLALFEKSLTPSDVGKLNRLVIPKQHAERYFPMKGAESIKDKGSLLSFEDGDDVAKTWRFRYSYWNSSQSYVLTKGWSRFVKEKKLEAGDIVLFFSHGVDAARLFIGWRRRSSGGGGKSQPAVGGGGGSNILLSSSSSGYPYPTHHQLTSSVQNQPHSLHTGSEVANQATAASSNCRRLRLFGVNLECQLADDSEPSMPDGSPMLSRSGAHRHQHGHYYSNYYNHMDINFSGGEDTYRQG